MSDNASICVDNVVLCVFMVLVTVLILSGAVIQVYEDSVFVKMCETNQGVPAYDSHKSRLCVKGVIIQEFEK